MKTRSPAVAGMADSWRQINLLGGQGHRRCPMLSMISISQAWDATCDFHFRDLEITPWKLSNVKFVYDFESPVNVNQGQRSRCTFVKWAMVNISVYRLHGSGATDKTIRTIFTFVALTIEKTSSRSSNVNFLRILKVRYRLPNSVS